MSKSDHTDHQPSADERLMHYYDGQLDEAAEAEIAARLTTDEEARDKLASMQLLGELLRESAAADDRGDQIVDGVMANLDQPLSPSASTDQPIKELPRTAPANDNSRTIFAMAGVAATVALGLFMWGRADVAVPLADLGKPTAPAAMTEPQKAPAPAVDTAAPSEADSEEEGPTVEVASVDFGAHSGSVFYVPSGQSGLATAVVWVTDVGEEEL